MAPSKLQQLGGFHWRFAGSVQADVRRGELKNCTFVQTLAKFSGAELEASRGLLSNEMDILVCKSEREGSES